MSITLELEAPCHHYDTEHNRYCRYGWMADFATNQPVKTDFGSEIMCTQCKGSGKQPSELGQQILDFVLRYT